MSWSRASSCRRKRWLAIWVAAMVGAPIAFTPVALAESAFEGTPGLPELCVAPLPVITEDTPPAEPAPTESTPPADPTAQSEPEPSVPYVCPDAVIDVVTSAGINEVMLSWTPGPNSEQAGVTSYVVDVRSEARVESVAAPATSITIAGLPNGVPARFAVHAVGPNGASIASAEVVATPMTGVEGEVAGLIVKFADSEEPAIGETVTVDDPGDITGDLVVADKVTDDVVLVALAEAVSVAEAEEIADKLSDTDGVEWAEPDQFLFTASRARSLVATVDAASSSSQWNLWDTFGIGAGDATTQTGTAGTGITVAVIDTGITDHPALRDVLVDGYDFVSDPQALAAVRENGGVAVPFDGDYVAPEAFGGLGRDDDPTDPGDWRGVAPVRPSSWHGTQIAGVIAAQANGPDGIVGVAPGASIQPIRALSWRGGLLSDIAAAIAWASGAAIDGVATNRTPSQVINLSFAVESVCPTALQSAIDTAITNGSVVVAAAGNANANVSGFAPANCDGVIAVGATTRDGERASYSNWGSGIAVSAPGGSSDGSIVTTSNDGPTTPGAPTYGTDEGTSIAAAHVAAAAAVIWADDPSRSAADIFERLTGREYVTRFDGACDTDSDKTCGSGIVSLAQIASQATADEDYAMTFTGNGATAGPYLTSDSSGVGVPSTNTSDLSAMAWVRPVAACTSACTIATVDGTWVIQLTSTGVTAGIWSGDWKFVTDSQTVPLNAWTHIAFTYQHSTREMTLYINGVSAASTTFAGDGNLGLLTRRMTIGVIDVGSPPTSTRSQYGPAGAIDEVKVWGSLLTDANVASAMHTYGMQSFDDPLVHYDFNEGSTGSSGGTVFNRVSGASETTHLRAVGGPTYSDVKETTFNGDNVVITFPRSYLTAAGGWRVPRGATSLETLIVGGGGGGGGGGYNSTTSGGGGGGGGAGQAVASTLTPAVGSVTAVVVGQGGSGGIGGSKNESWGGAIGSDGGPTSTLGVSAAGGNGGCGASARLCDYSGGWDDGYGGAGGASGSGQAGGSRGTSFGFGGGGGGGATGTGSNAFSAAGASGGAGVASSLRGAQETFATGGRGGSGAANATAGDANSTSIFGGGGNGGNGESGQIFGGRGAMGTPGVVIVSYSTQAVDTVDLAVQVNAAVTNQYLSAVDDDKFEVSGAFTFSTWVRPTVCSPLRVYLAKEETFVFGCDGNTWRYALFSGGWYGWINTGEPARTGAWSHLAWTRAGANSPVKLYVDGQLVFTDTGSTGALNNQNNSLVVGGRTNGEFFSGQIDEVRIYSTELTQAQIVTDMHNHGMNAGVAAADQRAYYDFNQGTDGAQVTSVRSQISGVTRAPDLVPLNGPTFDDVKVVSTNGGSTIIDFPRSYLTAAGGWQVPKGIGSVQALVVAGGGGGGWNVGGGGGGGGVQTNLNLALVPESFQRITVGQGGWGANYPANTPSPSAGGTGQDSILGASVVQSAGGGGGRSNAANSDSGFGGTGGPNQITGGRINGGRGATASLVAGGGGGGGLLSGVLGGTWGAAGGGGAWNTGAGGAGGTGGGGAGGANSVRGAIGLANVGAGGGGGGFTWMGGGSGGAGLIRVVYGTAGVESCAPTTYVDGDDTVVVFEEVGTCTWRVPPTVATVNALVVGGGGGGGGGIGGGGGAGEFIERSNVSLTPGTMQTIVVGAGGGGGSYTSVGSNGTSSSVFGSTAGGGGGGANVGGGVSRSAPSNGASGGGGICPTSPQTIGGTSNASGGGFVNIGGNGSTLGGSSCAGGGGGGAGAPGAAANTAAQSGGKGGIGRSSSITGATLFYAAGGGGGVNGGIGAESNGSAGFGGLGGGGQGGRNGGVNDPNGDGFAARDGTGSGGGGASNGYNTDAIGGDGGSGVVIVRYSNLPESPTGLTATPGLSEIDLSWSAPSHTGNATISQYSVQYSTTADFASVTTVATGSTSTSHTISGLTANTTYHFRVAAVTSTGTSPYTGGTSAKPFGEVAKFIVTMSGGDTALSTAAKAAGTAFSVRVTAQDVNDNVNTAFTGTVSLTSTAFIGTVTATIASGGVVDAVSVTPTIAGAGRTMSASSGAVTTSSAAGTFTVNAAAVAKLQVLLPGETSVPGSVAGKTGTPTAASAGNAVNVIVNAVDAHWNLVSTATPTVAITSSDGSATLPANAALVSGTRTFPVTFATATTHTVTATDQAGTPLTADTSSTVTVGPGTAAKLVVDTIATQNAGVGFSVMVTLTDTFGNAVNNTGAAGTVTLSRRAGTGTLAGTTSGTMAVGSSSVTISGVTYSKAESGVELTASGTGASSLVADKTGASNAFAVAAGAATSYSVSLSSTTPDAGGTITVTAQLQDSNGNPVSTASKVVTWSTSATGGSFASATSTTNANGVATVVYTVSQASGATGTITATDNTSLTGTSPSLTTQVGPVSAARSQLTTSVTSRTVGGANVTVTVTAKDQYDNNLTTGGDSVTITLSGAGTLSATTDNNDGTYTATLTVPTTEGTGTLSATIGVSAVQNGSGSNQTITVTYTADVASALVITGGGTQTAGASQNLTITATDQYGNTATTYTGDKSLTFSGAPMSPGGTRPTMTDKDSAAIAFGTATTVTFTNGVATGAVVLYAAGVNTISVSDGTLTSASGGNLAVTVGASGFDSLQITDTAGGSIAAQTAGTAFNIRVRALDEFGNVATSFTGTVDLASTSQFLAGGGTTPAFTAGELSSHSVTLVTAGFSHTITATRTSGGSETVTSNTFVIDPGAAGSFIVNTSDATPRVSTSFTVTAQVTDAYGNPRADGGVTVTWSRSNAAFTLSSATSTTDISGAVAVEVTAPATNATTTVTATSGALTATTATIQAAAACSPTTTASGTTTTITFTSTTPCFWSVPAGVSSLDVLAIGGGGGGGGGIRQDAGGGAGGGGGGGQYRFLTGQAVTGGSDVLVDVGAGGARGVAADGAAGEASSFGAIVSAAGGDGGRRGTIRTGGAGGTGGFGGTAVNGANGGNGTSNASGKGANGSALASRSFGGVTYCIGGGGGGGNGNASGNNNTATLGGGCGVPQANVSGGSGEWGNNAYRGTTPGVEGTGGGGGGGGFVFTNNGRGGDVGGSGKIVVLLTMAALTPTFATATKTTGGFTVPITNFDANYTWSATSTAGTASVSGGTLTVTGLTASQQATVTITTSRPGYAGASATIAGQARAAQAALNFVSTSAVLGSTTTLSTTGGTGDGAVDFALVGAGTASCSLSGDVLSYSSGGTCTVSATKQADADYDSQTTGTVTFTVIGPSASTSTLTVSDATLVADGASTSTVTVTLKDSNNNTIEADVASIAMSTTAGTLSGVTYLSGGRYIATLTSSTTAGTATVTATLDSQAMTATETVSFVAGAATKVMVATAPVASASGSALSTQPTVRITDVNDNTVTTSSASVTVTASSGALSGTTTLSASSGVVSFAGLSFAGLVTTSHTLTFASDGLTSATATITPTGVGPAVSIAANGGNGQSAVMGSTLPTAPSVVVRDSGGNPVSGTQVVFSVAPTAQGGELLGLAPTPFGGTLPTVRDEFNLFKLVPANTACVTTATSLMDSANATGYTVAVYADAAGGPGQLLGSLSQSNSGSSTVTYSGTVALTAGVSYWIGTRGSGQGYLSNTHIRSGSQSSPWSWVNSGVNRVVTNNGGATWSSWISSWFPAITLSGVTGGCGGPDLVGHGTLATPGSPATVTTDANGVAISPAWTISNAIGVNRLFATSGVLNGSPVTFTATGTARPITIVADDITAVHGTNLSPAFTRTGALAGTDAISGVTYTYTGTGATAYGPSTTPPTSAGTYSVTPSAATFSSGSPDDYDISYVTGTATITKANQTITFNDPAPSGATYGDAPIPLVATATSALTVEFNSTDPAICTVSGGAINLVTAGSCEITASQPGDANFEAATSVSHTFTIAKDNQATLTMTSPSTAIYGQTITVAASGGSGTGQTVIGVVAGTCTLANGTTLTLGNAGSVCQVQATRVSDANYNLVTSAIQTITITQAGQTLAFTSTVPATPVSGDTYTPVAIAVSTVTGASSGVTATFAVTGACSIANGVVTFTASGNCVVTASAASNTNFTAATSITQTIAVGSINQNITFGQPTNTSFGSSGFALVAGSSSSLPVTFALGAGTTNNACSVTSLGVVTPLAVGTCEVTASQPGDSQYAAASPVTRAFQVVPARATAPTLASASAGAQSITVAFSTPGFTGGVAITAYRVVATPVGAGTTVTDTSCTGSPCTISGLVNGVAYTVTVAAINAAGTGTASGATGALTPATSAFAVGALSAVPGDTVVDLSWTPLTTPQLGGGTFTRYEVSYRPAGVSPTPQWILATAALTTQATSSHQVTGLDNGTSYDFQVVAITSANTSEIAGNTAQVVQYPSTAPSEPQALSVLAATATDVQFSWSAPLSDGGSPLVAPYYSVTVSSNAPGAASPVACAVSGTDMFCSVTGLTSGVTYNFEVAAINRMGVGTVATTTYNVPSSDSSLANLVLTSGGAPLTLTPAFSPQVTSYTAEVAHTVASIDVGALANTQAATVTVTRRASVQSASNASASSTVSFAPAMVRAQAATSSVALEVGSNIIDVDVVASDPRFSTAYTVTVTRATAPVPVSDASTSGQNLPEQVSVRVRPNSTVTIDPIQGEAPTGQTWNRSTMRLVDPVTNQLASKVVTAEGTWRINSRTGKVTFTAAPGFTGRAELEFMIETDSGDRHSTTLSVFVPRQRTSLPVTGADLSTPLSWAMRLIMGGALLGALVHRRKHGRGGRLVTRRVWW